MNGTGGWHGLGGSQWRYSGIGCFFRSGYRNSRYPGRSGGRGVRFGLRRHADLGQELSPRTSVSFNHSSRKDITPDGKSIPPRNFANLLNPVSPRLYSAPFFSASFSTGAIATFIPEDSDCPRQRRTPASEPTRERSPRIATPFRFKLAVV